MPLDKNFYFHTKGDGVFGETSPEQLGCALVKMNEAGSGVIHIHGGLVSKKRALAKAERLKPLYEAAAAHPLFAVWESGLLETVNNNLPEIAGEKIFETMLTKLLKWVAGKLLGGVVKSAALPFPNDLEVKRQLRKLDQSELPFAELGVDVELTELTPSQENAFVKELNSDPDFQKEVRAIVLTHSETIDPNNVERSALVQAGAGVTRLNAAVVRALREDNQDGQKAVISGIKLAVLIGKVMIRVIRRFVNKRDHGMYTTIVEELLREVYLDDAGGLIWESMKRDTKDTFEEVGTEPARAGWTLVQKLGELYGQKGQTAPISVVAHSAGSIYACHLLLAIHKAKKDPAHPLPSDFKLRNLVFLAPAVRFDLFSSVLALEGNLFERFRMFSLNDEIEAGYWEVPAVYPRSLLYLVSGVAERRRDDSHFDCPLVGMQRYYDEARYPQPELNRVRDFIKQQTNVIWSKTPAPPGAATMAETHGAFDSDQTTLNSIAKLLR